MKNKVILILIDGMRPDGTDACGNDTFRRLMAEGTSCFHASTVMPSVTLPCHTSMFFSVDPERHGVMTNTWHPLVRPIDSLGDTVRKFDGKTAMFYNWEQLRDLNQPGSMNCSFFRALPHDTEDARACDVLLTSAALDYIRQEQPDFTFLYLGATDEAGHDHGWMSAEYLRTLNNALDCVDRIRKALPENYSLILTADHGGHDRRHGEDVPADMTIPIVCVGERFEAGRELESMNIKDIAPTVLDVLGVPAPQLWDGRSILK